jgi:hypothetical protein
MRNLEFYFSLPDTPLKMSWILTMAKAIVKYLELPWAKPKSPDSSRYKYIYPKTSIDRLPLPPMTAILACGIRDS